MMQSNHNEPSSEPEAGLRDRVGHLEDRLNGLGLEVIRERTAKSEARLDTLEKDNVLSRERIHVTAGEVQRNAALLTAIQRAQDQWTEQIREQTTTWAVLSTKVETHVTTVATELKAHMAGCMESNATAHEERMAFRREVRRYCVGFATALVIFYLQSKFNLTAIVK